MHIYLSILPSISRSLSILPSSIDPPTFPRTIFVSSSVHPLHARTYLFPSLCFFSIYVSVWCAKWKVCHSNRGLNPAHLSFLCDYHTMYLLLAHECIYFSTAYCVSWPPRLAIRLFSHLTIFIVSPCPSTLCFSLFAFLTGSVFACLSCCLSLNKQTH
jgi:hypothetical protein